MTCADYKRWLSPYLDGLLAVDERAQLEAHLMDCAGCRADLVGLQEMLQSLRSMGRVEVPELLPGIHERLQAGPWWHRVAQRFLAPWPASLPLHGLAMAATAILVVIVVGLPSVFRRDAAPHVTVESDDKLLRLASSPVPDADSLAEGRTNVGTPVGGNEDQAAVGDEYDFRDKESISHLAAAQREQEPAKPSSVLGEAVAALSNRTLRKAGALEGTTTFSDANGALRYEAFDQSGDELSAVMTAQWHVNHVPTAATEVADWVRAHHGSLTPIDDRHLTIQLAGADVSAFLQRFSDSAATPEAQPPAEQAKDASPISWVTISLELVPSQ